MLRPHNSVPYATVPRHQLRCAGARHQHGTDHNVSGENLLLDRFQRGVTGADAPEEEVVERTHLVPVMRQLVGKRAA